MTKLKTNIRNELNEKSVELLESEFVIKLAEAFPGAKVICLKTYTYESR